MLNTNCIYSPIWNCMSQNKNRTVILSKKMDCCHKINGNKIFDIFELFRCYFDLFSMFLFDVLSFYIMPFLYFCFSIFCRSMFRHRSVRLYRISSYF